MADNDPPRIRAASVYVDSTKVGMSKSGSLDEDGNDEESMTDEGFAMSDGHPTSKLKLDVLRPIAGRHKFLEDAFYNKKYVRVEITPLEGRIKTIMMRITKMGTNWNHKTGMCDGAFEFSGGQAVPT